MLLRYPVVATTMDKLQWDYIMSPIFESTLPRMGFVCTFSQDIVYTPANCSGMGVYHPWHKNQHLSQMKVVAVF
jgi:hypothetical protein